MESRRDRTGLLLLDSAVLHLAPSVVIEDGGLREVSSEDFYALNPLGRRVALDLEHGIVFRALVRSISQEFHISLAQARGDLQLFVSRLDREQLLSVEQSFVAEFLFRLRRRGAAVFGLSHGSSDPGRRSPSRRYPATARSILVASLKAHQPTALIAFFILLAIEPLIFLPTLIHGSVPSLRMALLAAEPLLAYAALLAVSMVLHELIHYWVARQLRVPLKSVFVAPGRIGITQVSLRPPDNAIVSGAGPAGTVVVMILLGLLMPLLQLGYPFSGIAGPLFCGAVAVVHLFGLTPLTKDGQSVWTLLGYAPTPVEKPS